MKGIRPAALCLAAVLCVQPLLGGATYYPDRQSAYTGENTIEIESPGRTWFAMFITKHPAKARI